MTATDFTQRLGIAHPIVQGPFGGVPTAKLAAAVGEAGGLGSYGCFTHSPDEITRIAADIRALTDKPFAFNLWVSVSDPGGDALDPDQFEAAWKIFAPLYDELRLDKPRPPERLVHSFEAQVEALIEARPAVFSFIFGVPRPAILAECSRRGITTVGAATTLAEAEALDNAGADAIIATGFEAGGHRPSFLARAEDSLMGTLTLTRLVAAKIKRPVIAAGGIVDKAGIQAAFDLGAAAVQLGTAFLACEESGAAPQHRDVLFSAATERTVLTRAYSGRLCRVVPNRLVETLQSASTTGGYPPFPVPAWFTAPLRKAAAEQGRTDFLALLSGQGAPLLKHRKVPDLMASLTSEG
jgi:nitronate monooxygenase